MGGDDTDRFGYSYKGQTNSGLPPRTLGDEVGIDCDTFWELVNINDVYEATFAEIADYVEEKL